MLLVHSHQGGAILVLVREHQAVSSLVLDHHPGESELKDFVEFGRTHKQCVPEKILLSDIEALAEEHPSLGLDVVTLDPPLDPVRGALLIDLSSTRDADRLDLPVRGNQRPWYRRLLSL